MNVLIVPEDFRKDQYILKPLIEALLAFKALRSKVSVLTDPLLGGIDQALDLQNIELVLDQYMGMVDLFLLCVDRDCEMNRQIRLNQVETRASTILPAHKRLFAVAAREEIETWALAGIEPLIRGWRWNDIREECHPKEIYFEPYAQHRGLEAEVGGGRKTIGQEAARNYRRVRQLCAQDLQALEARI